jgi:hypothetical protein
MHMNIRNFPSILACSNCLAALSVLVAGCTSSSDSATSLGAPSITIEKPIDGSCATLVSDDSGETLRAQFAVSNWSLRPKGFCSVYQYAQCGYAVAFVDGVRFIDTASLVVEIPRTTFSSDSPHTLRIELHTDDHDLIAADPNGVPLRQTVTFSLPPVGSLSCPDLDGGTVDSSASDASDGGIDATSDTGVDAPADTTVDSAIDASAGDSQTDAAADAALDSALDSSADAATTDAADAATTDAADAATTDSGTQG